MKTVTVSIGLMLLSAVIWHYMPEWIKQVEKGEMTGSAAGDWIFSICVVLLLLFVFYKVSRNYVFLPYVQFYT